MIRFLRESGPRGQRRFVKKAGNSGFPIDVDSDLRSARGNTVMRAISPGLEEVAQDELVWALRPQTVWS